MYGEGQATLFTPCDGKVSADLEHVLILGQLVVRSHNAEDLLGVGLTDDWQTGDILPA